MLSLDSTSTVRSTRGSVPHGWVCCKNFDNQSLSPAAAVRWMSCWLMRLMAYTEKPAKHFTPGSQVDRRKHSETRVKTFQARSRTRLTDKSACYVHFLPLLLHPESKGHNQGRVRGTTGAHYHLWRTAAIVNCRHLTISSFLLFFPQSQWMLARLHTK